MRRLVHQSFKPTSNGLACDDVSVEAIVERVGTPAYIYSARAIREAYRAIDESFAPYPHAIHYALKANSTLAIVGCFDRGDRHEPGGDQVARRCALAISSLLAPGRRTS
jgi:hypothetical protein